MADLDSTRTSRLSPHDKPDLRPLNVQPGIHLDLDSSHTRILREHDEGIRTVLQESLMLERRLVFDRLDRLRRVFQALNYASVSEQHSEAW